MRNLNIFKLHSETDVTATIYYPTNNATWTEEVVKAMAEDGEITWKTFVPEVSSTSTTGNPTSPKTGDPVLPLFFAFVALMAGSSIILVKRKSFLMK